MNNIKCQHYLKTKLLCLVVYFIIRFYNAVYKFQIKEHTMTRSFLLLLFIGNMSCLIKQTDNWDCGEQLEQNQKYKNEIIMQRP